MGKTHMVVSEGLAYRVIESFRPPDLGSCDPECGMSLVELRDFWWAYTYDTLCRLPSSIVVEAETKKTNRVLRVTAQSLLDAGEATLDQFIDRRIEPRLGRVGLTRFALRHLLPTLAENISHELKDEVWATINDKYGSNVELE